MSLSVKNRQLQKLEFELKYLEEEIEGYKEERKRTFNNKMTYSFGSLIITVPNTLGLVSLFQQNDNFEFASKVVFVFLCSVFFFFILYKSILSFKTSRELKESIENTRLKIAELIDEKNRLVQHINNYKTDLVNAKNKALLYLNSKLKLRKMSKIVEGLFHYSSTFSENNVKIKKVDAKNIGSLLSIIEQKSLLNKNIEKLFENNDDTNQINFFEKIWRNNLISMHLIIKATLKYLEILQKNDVIFLQKMRINEVPPIIQLSKDPVTYCMHESGRHYVLQCAEKIEFNLKSINKGSDNFIFNKTYKKQIQILLQKN
mgnify:CR=1 FL=1|tara:strand:- start:41865 stop:42812 length:948 start_codon:yes stop_codon:yes gene_type:complete